MWGISWSMNMMTIMRRIGATVLFIIGLLGLILPVLPGLPMIALGLYFLSLDSPGMQSRILQLRQKYTYFDKLMRLVDTKIDIIHDEDGPKEVTDTTKIH